MVVTLLFLAGKVLTGPESDLCATPVLVGHSDKPLGFVRGHREDDLHSTLARLENRNPKDRPSGLPDHGLRSGQCCLKELSINTRKIRLFLHPWHTRCGTICEGPRGVGTLQGSLRPAVVSTDEVAPASHDKYVALQSRFGQKYLKTGTKKNQVYLNV